LSSSIVGRSPNSSYGHLFCDRRLRAGCLKNNQQSANFDCNQLPEIGAFLLSLIGMKSKGFVQIWRENYQACVTNCVDCAVVHNVTLSKFREKSVFMASGAIFHTSRNCRYFHQIHPASLADHVKLARPGGAHRLVHQWRFVCPTDIVLASSVIGKGRYSETCPVTRPTLAPCRGQRQ